MLQITLQDDVLSSNPLPGYGKVQELCATLTELAVEDTHRLAISKDTASTIVEQWGQLEEHDKDASKFITAYQARWGQCLYGRTKGSDPAQSIATQRVKISNLKCAAAQHVDAKRNRVLYTLIKQLWLHVSNV